MASAPTAPLPASSPPPPAPTGKRRKYATLYRGAEGMWSWVLHRVTGMLLFLFLLVHVLDTALVRVSPEVYNEVIGTYRNPIMGIAEIGLVAAVLFHAFNGVRIILVDFLATGPRYQRVMFWLVIAVTVVLLAGFIPRHLMNVFGGH